ncbi:RNase adapter RapZ [Jannaschia sp. Os4]|uniref:RNase adapter RapZ n=1 Tax=Jannaschia sp. Os4 TaxID=2807617 RepID=UPI00193A9788|nr:RNase adapter RapZ [Jannaschia sp. Os4]MBM2577185.1 RNase adapter RapZ [Jannaschia sp. Os4]
MGAVEITGTTAADGETGRRDDVVLVTGPSGAGRTTAIHALEDLGFEAIDNMPLGLLGRVVEPEAGTPRRVALGFALSTRGVTADALGAAVGDLRAGGATVRLVYLDADPEVLLRRFSESRRRHPLSPGGDPERGIARERALLAPLMDRADDIVDTSRLSPHDLKARLGEMFGQAGQGLSLQVESFSYKRGAPRGLDMMIDLRFLSNPHWVEALRPLTGLDAPVRAHVAADPRFAPFFEKLVALVREVLPAHRAEGRAYLTLGLGCTGGRHRSVAVAETLGAALAADGWRVSIRHRDLERAVGGTGRAPGRKGTR